MTLLEYKDVRRAYQPGREVIHGVSFSVAAGEVVGLLGRNGAGKTTLIRLAMGLLEPGAGVVRLFGLDPRQRPVEVKRRVGYVSEEQILPSYLRVREVINLHRTLFPSWDEELARGLGERFYLTPDDKVGSLSKGQARQLALLCAIAHRPELLLLDEPAGGLDPAARREFLETSIQLLNETGSSILFSSHHLTDVERMAGRIVILHDGRVLIDKDSDELREGCCVALVPPASGIDRAALLALDGCLAVRERSDAIHAVFRLDPQESAALLERRFGVKNARCRTVALEEMFIELTGGQG